MYVICDSQIADKGMANCAHQILGQDLTDVLRKLDDFELGRQVHTVERIQESSHPREGVNHLLSFHPPSVVQLQAAQAHPRWKVLLLPTQIAGMNIEILRKWSVADYLPDRSPTRVQYSQRTLKHSIPA